MKRHVLAALLLLGGCGCVNRSDPPHDTRPLGSAPPYVAPTFDAARTAGTRLVIPQDDCRIPRGAVVDEVPDEVRVTLLTDLVNPLPCETGGLTSRLTVPLRAPLGTRRLVDGGRGKVVRAFDSADLLAPPSLPAPFDVRRRDEGGSGDRWQLSWPAGDFAVFSRTGAPPARRDCPGRRPVTVRGVPGVACVATGTTTLGWTEGGLPRELSAGWSEAADAGPAPIDLPGLLRIAGTLRPLG